MKSFSARLVMVALGMSLLTGCQIASFDAEYYTSTVDKPLNFTMVAAQTGGAVLWSYEVPVNHKLYVQVYRKGDNGMIKVTPEKPPTHMTWALYDIYDNRLETGKFNLPGVPVYRKLAYRPSPEWPAGFVPPGSVAEAPPPEIIIVPDKPDTPDGDGDAGDAGDGDADDGDAGETGEAAEAPETAGAAEAPADDAGDAPEK